MTDRVATTTVTRTVALALPGSTVAPVQRP